MILNENNGFRASFRQIGALFFNNTATCWIFCTFVTKSEETRTAERIVPSGVFAIATE